MSFRNNYTEPVIDYIDDGEEIDGFIPNASESPSVLLARLRAGAQVSVHMPVDQFDDDAYHDPFDFYDQLESLDLGTPEIPDVEKNSTVAKEETENQPPSAQPSGPSDVR